MEDIIYFMSREEREFAEFVKASQKLEEIKKSGNTEELRFWQEKVKSYLNRGYGLVGGGSIYNAPKSNGGNK